MTKKEALILLSDYLDNNPLPINDVVVFVNGFEEYTFKGLLKIAYDF